MKFLFLFLLFAAVQSNAQEKLPPYIITWGKLPQLAYSSGEDRLGSAKMGYIDTLIVLKVVDTLKNLYRVKLSNTRHAYIDKLSAIPKPDSLPASDAPALTESWSVKGNDTTDVVTMTMTKRVPYKSWMEIDPTRIKIELYNVQCNTNWITQLKSAKIVKNIWYEQVEDDILKVTIDLHKKQHYGYSIGYEGNFLVINIRRTRPKNFKNMTIIIDAGHGGTNIGTTGVRTGITEKSYTLLFAKELQKILKKQKAKVLMVRDKDTTIDNKDRILWALQQNPDIFISFHLNSGRAVARGASTYYKHIGFRPLTQTILNRLLAIRNLQEFGNIGSFNFQPVQPTEYPSCLVEVAFLSNRYDEKMVRSQKFRQQVANQVYLGIKDWMKTID